MTAAIATGAGAFACNAIIGIDDVPVQALGDDGASDDASPDAGGQSAMDASLPDVSLPDATLPDAKGMSATEASSTACNLAIDDPHNCGACGHDCLGGQCMSGACQAWVLIGADAGLAPWRIAQDSAYLYWVDQQDGIVGRTDKSSGATTLLSTAAVLPGAVAVDDAGAFYWGDDNGVFRCPTAGCADSGPALVAAAAHETGVASLAVDGTYVYWSDQTSSIYSAHKYGSAETPVSLGDGDAGVEQVATDGQRVYFTADDELFHVMGVDGSGEFAVGTGSSSSTALGFAIDVDNGAVVWSESDTVFAAATTGVGAYSAIAVSQTNPLAVATDGLEAYWLDVPGLSMNAELVGCAIASCNIPNVLAYGFFEPSSVVVDDGAIYWADQDNTNGTLWKIAR
jgi:hypothetical protein